MASKNYFLNRDSKSGEITYLEYDKIDGYNITPKSKVEDAIIVNKIVQNKTIFPFFLRANLIKSP